MTARDEFFAGLARAFREIEEDNQNYRRWYSLITADQASREKYTFPFVDMLCDLPSHRSIASAFSKAELHSLRQAIWTECEKDLMPFLKAASVDPAVRQRLAEYYQAIQRLDPPTEYGVELVSYTLLCIALDRHREARNCAKIILSRSPNDDSVRALFEFAEDHMSFPRFHAAFISRSTNAWRIASKPILQYTRGRIPVVSAGPQGLRSLAWAACRGGHSLPQEGQYRLHPG